MKRTLILLLGLGFMMGWVGEARSQQQAAIPKAALMLAHHEHDDQQKVKMFEAMVNEERRLRQAGATGIREGNSFLFESRVGDIGYLVPSQAVMVYRVVDEWNCILSVYIASDTNNYANDNRTRRALVWLEDYSTADIFAGDRIWLVGRFKIVDAENVDDLTDIGGQENQREMKIRVIRLLSQDEIKNPTVYEAREAKEKLKKAELAGDEKAIDKAMRRAWTINGTREWAIFDGERNGQVSLRFSKIHPTKRIVEEIVKTYAIGVLSKEDRAWVEEMKKN